MKTTSYSQKLLLSFLLFFSVLSFNETCAQNNVTAYASATNVSTWNAMPCDGIFTFWIEGTTQPYFHEYTISGPGGPYVITSIDTLITITGLCPGTYIGNVTWNQPCYDTSLVNNCTNCMPVICPTYPTPCPVDSCTNCTGGSGSGGSGGAGATIEAPPQLFVDVEVLNPTLSPCYNTYPEFVEYIVTASGGVPPYQINGTNWLPINANQFKYDEPYNCSEGAWPGNVDPSIIISSIQITDAVGQTVSPNSSSSVIIPTVTVTWGVDYCICTSFPTPISNISMCSGETISLSSAPQGCSFQLMNDFWHWSPSFSNSFGFPDVVEGINSSVNYTAPIVNTTSSFDVTLSGFEGLNNSPINNSNTYTCAFQDYFTITINPAPTINAGSDQSICEGGQVTLSGSGGTSYVWDNGISDNVLFTPTLGTTTYEVTGTDANSCQNTDQVDVTVHPNIAAGVNQTVCAGDQITLSGSGGSSYVWNNGISDGVAFIPPIGVTTYSVTGAVGNGCQNTDQVEITVNELPAINAGMDQELCDGDQLTLFGSGGASYAWNNGISDNTAFTPTLGTTTYEVTGTDINGCQNTDQVEVNVNALPSIGAGSDQTLCAGDQVALSGSGGVTYLWNNGVVDGIPFSPPIGITTYTVNGTDANGCQNMDEIIINMGSPISNSLTINVAEITAVAGYANYNWVDCETNTSVQNGSQNVYIAVQNGQYKAIITNFQGCGSASSCATIDVLTIGDLYAENAVVLAPNPTADKVYISNGKLIESIVIYDAVGRIVDQIDDPMTELDFSKFETGYYIVQMDTRDNRVVIARVLKE